MSLPTDDAARKMIRIWQGFIQYFPDAVAAVAQLSKIANEQHNPGEPMHWAKEKSTEELDSMMNHLVDIACMGEDGRDTEGVLHATKVAWRAMANLQRLADKGVDIFAVLPRPQVLVAETDDGWEITNLDGTTICRVPISRAVDTKTAIAWYESRHGKLQ